MFGFVRIACGLVLILLLGVAAVLRMPTAAEVNAGHQCFATFGAGAGDFELPSQWAAVDPFTARTPYLGQIWFPELPAFSTHVMYLRSRIAQQEMFVMWGPSSELAPLFMRASTRWDHHSLTHVGAERSAKTAEGVTVKYREAMTDSGRSAGDGARYFLGSATVGSSMLVLNGGGIAGEFDDAAFPAIIRSLKLPR